jgi:hypothetical protein
MPDPWRPLSLSDAYALAYLEGLGRRPVLRPAQRPLTVPPTPIPLDDTGRAPVVPLRPRGGDRG